jgi:hypothetical protein
MKSIDAAHTRPVRRPPVRIDAQEGPWSVSVAETPHDAHSYSIYIKSESNIFRSTLSPLCWSDEFVCYLRIWIFVWLPR